MSIFKRGVVNIERGIVLADGELIEQSTKTHQGRRVALDDRTRATLLAHRDRMASNAGAVLPEEAFVFSHSLDGSSPWHPDSTTRAFRNLCERAGVRGIRLHDLRHYVATGLLAAGVDVRTVAGRLGHRNAATTLNVYAHFVPESDRDAATALGDLFNTAMKSAEPTN